MAGSVAVKRKIREMSEGQTSVSHPLTPPLLTTIAAARQAVADARGRGLTVGLVPTLGALHAGHASLLRAARAETDFVVASIFVNPTQFGPHEDFHRYPRPLEQDLARCAAERVDAVFHPDVETMYPEPFYTFVEVPTVQDGLCGGRRPGHFRGVATVVLKLLNIVRPDVLYLGQKDAQQVRSAAANGPRFECRSCGPRVPHGARARRASTQFAQPVS